MTSNNSEICFTDDIIERVAKELDESEREVRKIYKFVVEYILHLAKNTKCVAIKIPKLGYLYANDTKIRSVISRLEMKRKREGLNEVETKKLEVLYKKYELLQGHKKTIHRFFKKKKRASYHYRYPTTKSPHYTNEMSFEEIEDFQKELAKKS